MAEDRDDLPAGWPVEPALKLYDVKRDTLRPATQADLDKLLRIASASAQAAGMLTGVLKDTPDG